MDTPPTGPAAWYIRRGIQVSGPFPQGLLVRYLELGRLKAPDEVSADGINWFAIADVPVLASVREAATDDAEPVDEFGEIDWNRERGRARRRWLEERWVPDRRMSAGGETGAGRERGPDRRADPAARSGVHFQAEANTQASRVPAFAIAAAVLLSVGVATTALWQFAPREAFKVVLFRARLSDCAAPPAPSIRWSGCDKRGADLVRADLSGARMENAILAGANLTGSRLDGADLRNADMRGADLSGASIVSVNLSGARLGEARWIDGRSCAPDSIGGCTSSTP